MSRMSKRRRIRFKGLLQDSCSRMVLAQDPLQVCHSQSGERKNARQDAEDVAPRREKARRIP